MPDKYKSFAELSKSEKGGRDYDVVVLHRRDSKVAIVAPHGGGIEPGTSELAMLIVGTEHNLFTFRGLKPRGNRELHIASDRFDHPECVPLLSRCAIAIGIHGCKGQGQIYVGGLDSALVSLLTKQLTAAKLPATTDCPSHLAGREPKNICNRGTRGRGAQLEMTLDMRTERARVAIAAAVRAAIVDYAETLTTSSP